MHHLHGAAREAKRHGPEGSLTRPIGDLVEGCERVLHGADFGFLAGEGVFAAEATCDGKAARGARYGGHFGGGFRGGGGDGCGGSEAKERRWEGRCCGGSMGCGLWRWERAYLVAREARRF